MSEQVEMSPIFGDHSVPEPLYEDISIKSFYLTMRDGVRIAIDLILPSGLLQSNPIPALIQQTRYWRATEFRKPFHWFFKAGSMQPKEIDARYFFPTRGYALLNVDVRGTGASFGTLRHPWSKESIEDAREIVDWIITQPWSNGNVGGLGTSYPGTASELLAVLQHPAVKVVIPKFNHPDGYQDIAFPGGLFNQRFIRYWGYFDHVLDQNIVPDEFGKIGKLIMRGVKPVDGDRGRRLLKVAIREHTANGPVFEIASQVTFRDDTHEQSGISMEDLMVHRFMDELRNSPTVIYGWGSWLDAGTGDAVIRRFLTFEHARRAVIGAWDHGGSRHASPFVSAETPASPQYVVQLAEMLRVFDAFLKESDAGLKAERALYYYTMGEECWKRTDVWPPEGVVQQRWYFHAGGNLAPLPPEEPGGQDTYTVDFTVSSGDANRWWEMGVLDKKSVEYPDRADLKERMLSYTTSPFAQDMEISGHPVVTLYVESTEADTAFYVYLEDVAPDGRVTYLTEGLLRSLHRKITQKAQPYVTCIPQHSYMLVDAEPLNPGEAAAIEFGLFATSVLVRKGHCLRVSLAGHDEGTFRRVPEEGTPVITVHRNQTHPSSILLPVIPRGEQV